MVPVRVRLRKIKLVQKKTDKVNSMHIHRHKHKSTTSLSIVLKEKSITLYKNLEETQKDLLRKEEKEGGKEDI